MKKLKVKPKIHKCVCTFLIIIAFLFLIYNNYDFFNKYRDTSKIFSQDAVRLRLDSLDADLNNFPRTSVNDIAYLSKLDHTKEIFQFEEGALKNDLLEFMKQNSAYYQIILLNTQGEEIFSIKNNQGVYSENFGDEKSFLDNSFLSNVLFLIEDEVIVSDIILEENKNERLPSLSYATTVYNEDTKLGYFVLKANANYFLDDIRYAQREGEEVFLIRENGEYLSNTNTIKEFSFNEGVSFYSDYPLLEKENILGEQPDFLDSKNHLLSFKYITISKGYFIDYSGGKEQLWILVSVTDKAQLNIPSFKIFLLYQLPVVVILIVFFLSTIYSKRKEGKKEIKKKRNLQNRKFSFLKK